jgi:hypothetical protein
MTNTMSKTAMCREGARLLFETHGTEGSVFSVQEMVEIAQVDPDHRSGVAWWFRKVCRANGLAVVGPTLNSRTLNKEYQVTTQAPQLMRQMQRHMNTAISLLENANFEATLAKATATTVEENITAEYISDVYDYAVKERGDVMRRLEEAAAAADAAHQAVDGATA